VDAANDAQTAGANIMQKRSQPEYYIETDTAILQRI